MGLLIDGYNLLNVVGILDRDTGSGSLQQARLALLNFLAESLPPREIAATTVVFDARNAPPGLPREVRHRGLTIRFAADYPDADSLIEELIEAEHAPRQLVVVSSDHRLHRAARRRRATPVDSDQWYAAVIRQRREQRESHRLEDRKPAVPLLDEDVAYWVRQFGGKSALTELLGDEVAWEADLPRTSERTTKPADNSTPRETPSQPNAETASDDLANPFPPGYAEDLLRKDEQDKPK